MTPRSAERGFTLIELVVVLTIGAILAGIGIQNYNLVLTKAEAARIATQLHYIEDAVVEAILDGAGPSELNVAATGLERSALADYLTDANLGDVPEGVGFHVVPSVGVDPFLVNIGITSDPRHADIIEELHSMFPRTGGVTRNGLEIWVSIDSGTLAPKTLPPA